MTAQYRAEYRKAKRAEQAAQISLVDQEALQLMEKLRRYTYGGELGDNPARTRRARADAGDRWHGGSDHRRRRIFLRQAAQPSAGPRHVAESAVVTTSVKVSTAD